MGEGERERGGRGREGDRREIKVGGKLHSSKVNKLRTPFFTCHVLVSREGNSFASALLILRGCSHTVPARMGRRPGTVP